MVFSIDTNEESGQELETLPTLYSLQHCPYAMRARLAIVSAEQAVMLRPITMHNKPEEMLIASPKGTVPVLVLNDNSDSGKSKVIDESLDIMLWALNQKDPQNLLYSHQVDALPEMLKIINVNDTEFKPSLENYKRAKRFHHDSEEADRLKCEPFIQELEYRLNQYEFFMGPTPSLLDYALLPFVRQFSKVHRPIFRDGPYTNLQRWLYKHLQSRIFSRAMIKYPLWMDSHEESVFGEQIT